jgi:hypothetical protein
VRWISGRQEGAASAAGAPRLQQRGAVAACQPTDRRGSVVQPEWLAGRQPRKPGAGSSAGGPPAACPSCPAAAAAAAAARPVEAGAGAWGWGRKAGGGGGRRTEESERCTRPSAGMRISTSSAALRRLMLEELRSRRRLQQRRKG